MENIKLLSAADHILPDNHSESVAVVIPAVRLNLDVLPEHIEAEALHCFNIVNHCLVARCGKTAVAPIALVKKSFLEIRLVVEEQPCVAVMLTDAELSHAKVALDRIKRIAVFEREHKVIKERLLRRPELCVFDFNAVVFADFLLCNNSFAVKNLD